MLRFVVLVHFVVVRFLICGLPVFEKQEGVGFLGCLMFLANFSFLAFDLWRKVKFFEKSLPFWRKPSVKISGENRRKYWQQAVPHSRVDWRFSLSSTNCSSYDSWHHKPSGLMVNGIQLVAEVSTACILVVRT